MTSQSKGKGRRPDLADYGFARVRDKAFDAVHMLWLKRKSQGVLLKDVAAKIGRDTGWVSKQLKGPGNWTLRTFGELVEALDGEAEIEVFGLEEPLTLKSNYDAYASHYTEKLVPLRFQITPNAASRSINAKWQSATGSSTVHTEFKKMETAS